MAISGALLSPMAAFLGKRPISWIHCALSLNRWSAARPVTAVGGRDGSAQVRRLYGRSRGKVLRAGQERLLAEALPLFSTTPEALAAGRAFASAPREIWLEIGFGAGEHLIRAGKSQSGRRNRRLRAVPERRRCGACRP